MKKCSKANFRIIIDTNILFSAIRYRGEAFKLLTLAERAGCNILIPEYVYEELREVFTRNGIDFNLVTDFLSTFENIVLVEKNINRTDLIELAKEKVSDRKDRPVFVYTLLLHEEDPSTLLVTGDKKLIEAVNGIRNGVALSVRGVLQKLGVLSEKDL